MKKGKLLYIILILLLFAIYVWIDSQKPPVTSWSYNFTGSSSAPYGCKVLREMMKKTFVPYRITDNFESPYQWAFTYSNVIIINPFFRIDTIDYNYLSYFVSEGNNVFISAEWFNQGFSDSLGFKVSSQNLNYLEPQKTHTLYLTNPALRNENGFLLKSNDISYFSQFDTSNTIILGYADSSLVNYIKIPHGHGAFYISTCPLAYSNYNILNANADYAFNSLSYLNDNDIIWDEYYKPENAKIYASTSPLRFILSKPALKSAYYLILFTFLLFIISEGRRKQRIIPIYQKPGNDALDFIKTVSMLFYNRRKHQNLLEKRITYLYDYLFTHFNIRVDAEMDDFTEVVSTKTGVDPVLINLIKSRIKRNNKEKDTTTAEMAEFMELTNKFLKLSESKI